MLKTLDHKVYNDAKKIKLKPSSFKLLLCVLSLPFVLHWLNTL